MGGKTVTDRFQFNDEKSEPTQPGKKYFFFSWKTFDVSERTTCSIKEMIEENDETNDGLSQRPDWWWYEDERQSTTAARQSCWMKSWKTGVPWHWYRCHSRWTVVILAASTWSVVGVRERRWWRRANRVGCMIGREEQWCLEWKKPTE